MAKVSQKAITIAEDVVIVCPMTEKPVQLKTPSAESVTRKDTSLESARTGVLPATETVEVVDMGELAEPIS